MISRTQQFLPTSQGAVSTSGPDGGATREFVPDEPVIEKCPNCDRTQYEGGNLIRCSAPGCEEHHFPDCCENAEFGACEECRAQLCPEHQFRYVDYVLCRGCHHAEQDKLVVIARLANNAAMSMSRTDQDGRTWTGFIGANQVVEMIEEMI